MEKDENVVMLYARTGQSDDRKQTCLEHAQNVALIAFEKGEKIGLGALMRLCGLLHDAGKVRGEFQAYLLDDEAKRGTVEHSAYGAVYAFLRWHGGSAFRKLTAELLTFAIASHHGRLPDVVDEDGEGFAAEKLTPERFPDLYDTMEAFFAEVAGQSELDALFERAVGELEQKHRQLAQALSDLPPASRGEGLQNLFGLVQRSVYSILIDADRWDAYCFEVGTDPLAGADRPWPIWQKRLEDKLAGFSGEKPLDALRASVSDECLRAAENGAGVYRLCVPTGGGKTFASMRYALEAAKRHGFERIVYVAPYKAILEQTAENLRNVFLDEQWILEHHSDAAPDEEKDSEALRRYQLLSDRWDSPLILTTMVQFLNTLFAGRSACVRRFSALENCVILLDEAQSIPYRCMELFTLAMRYLAKCGGCAVVLCTATQPLLDELARYPLCKPRPMIADENALYIGFRRVALLDRTDRPMDADGLARQVSANLHSAGSALCIVNTKATASALYQAFRDRLPDGVPLYCLTTAQCPEHRLKLLGEVRALLKARQPVVCVATQLIEAGVDVSFGLVVRALAGLDSVAQAAGRCNRNAERELGEVWLVCIEGENLTCLREIEAAQREMKSALDAFHADPQRYGNDLLSPALIERYFRTILRVRQGEMCYPLDGSRTLLDLLSSNAYGRNAYATFQKAKYADTMLSQAFRTAGQRFSALDASPFSLLVPYGKGAEYIDRLDGGPELAQAARILRAAQRYTVTVYPGKLEQFRRLHCVRELPIYGSYALDKAYYDDFLGVAADRKEMGLLDI